MFMNSFFRVGLFGLCTWAASAAWAHSESAAQAIAHAMKTLFDKPQAPLTVGPVSVEGDYAVAGWLQSQRGGRALLQKRQGQWVIVVCAGDGLKQAQTLTLTGMPVDAAQRLAAKVANAEASLPANTLRQLASFEGTLRIDGDAAHGHGANAQSAAGQNHPKH